MSNDNNTPESAAGLDFIRTIIYEDLHNGKHSALQTRFPPEPNGYLHIGHAKSICLNFGVAEEYDGLCNLRFDDTNPAKEDIEFVNAIKDDVQWLGFDWAALRHASDYFEVYYLACEKLIQKGMAYVCDLNAEDHRAYRGTLTEPGKNSPYRDRGIEENLSLFRSMRAGEFEDGSRTLRAKIDMTSGNMNMRDPALYRIRRLTHPMTGDAWCIYPMYDIAHCLGDAIEGITHSLCTLEFEDHRPLYDWLVEHVDLENDPSLLKPLHDQGINAKASTPRQIEFSRLNLDHTVMSKRKLTQLVDEHLVDGWDDPRMPSIRGMRRRGIPPQSIREFVKRLGVTKQNSVIEFAVLEGVIRDTLDSSAERRAAVINPLKLVLTNLPEDHHETLNVSNHPKDESKGHRDISFSRELWIEQDDFMLEPVKGFRRLYPGNEVRIRNAGIIKCNEAITDDQGNVTELHCTLDMESRPGMEGSKRKVKGTIHWLDAKTAIPTEFRLYDRLFTVENPGAGDTDFRQQTNPDSRTVSQGFVEPAAAQATPETRFQFERIGYFSAEQHDHTPEKPVFNRIVSLRDTWKK